jgi:hypothetical protein
MSKRLLLFAASLAGVSLAAGAVPALTATPGSASGSVVGTVSVPAPPAACITLSGSTVDFGTLSFSDPAAASTPIAVASPSIRITSCSTASLTILGAASDATMPSGGTWDAGNAFSNTCAIGLNTYEARWSTPVGGGQLYNPNSDGSFASQPGFPLVAGAGGDVTYRLLMPCRGSVGAGETASITFYTLAVLA